MMCPVKSRNGNNLRAKELKEQSRGELSPRPRGFILCSPPPRDQDPQEEGEEEEEEEEGEEGGGGMRSGINVVVLVMLVLLTGSSQAGGQITSVPPVLPPSALPSHAGSTASPDLAEHPGNEGTQWTHNPTGGDETSVETTTVPEARSRSEAATDAAHQSHLLTLSPAAPTSLHTDVSVTSHPAAPSPSAATDALSSTPPVPSTTPLQQHASTTEGRSEPPTTDTRTAFSSQPASTLQDSSSTAGPTYTIQPPNESLTTATAQQTTTGLPLTSVPSSRGPAGPTHRAVPSELNVGDEGLKSSPLDPLLAGLLSVFIVTTAVVFIVLFLKFRQRTNHPEFHRLQDLPMDDLMEDTPLSRYTY